MRRLCGSTLETTPKLRKHLPPQRAFSGWYPRLLLMYNLILAVTSSRIFHKGKKCSPKTSWFAQLFHRAMHFSPLELSEANAGYTGSIIFPIIKSFRVFLLYIVVDQLPLSFYWIQNFKNKQLFDTEVLYFMSKLKS